MKPDENAGVEITLSSLARMRPSLQPPGRGSGRALGMICALLLVPATPAAARSSTTSPNGADSPEQQKTLDELVRAAEEAGLRVDSSEDPQDRALAAFHGYQLWLRAYAVDSDPRHICAAREQLTELLEDDGIDDAIREDSEARVADLDQTLSELDGHTCDHEDANDQEPTAAPTRANVLLPARASRSAGTVGIDADPRSPRIRRLQIAGVLGVGLGASLLAAMTYGIVVDARTATQLQDYARKKDAGELTEEDWAESQRLGEKGRAGARLAVFAGIGGTAALVTGAVLLLTGRQEKRRGHGLALSPALGASHAQLILRGRF